MNNIFWPSIDDLWDAKKACIQASSVAFLVGTVTGVIAFLQLRGVTVLEGITLGNFIDAGIFLALAVFIYRGSRIASLAGLALYAYGQVLVVQQTHRLPITGIFFSLLFISGIRGAFAFHEMKAGMSAEEIKTRMKELRVATEPAPSLAKRIIAWVVLIAIVAGGYLWYRSASRQPESRLIVRDATPLPATTAPKNAQAPSKIASFFPPTPKATASAPQPGQQTFKLKDGRAVTGKVVKNDPDYYTVEVSGGRQEIVFKDDLKSSGN